MWVSRLYIKYVHNVVEINKYVVTQMTLFPNKIKEELAMLLSITDITSET